MDKQHQPPVDSRGRKRRLSEKKQHDVKEPKPRLKKRRKPSLPQTPPQSPSPPQIPPNASLLGLPRELRDKIFEYLIHPLPERWHESTNHPFFHDCIYPTTLIRVNHQIHEEVMQRVCALSMPTCRLMLGDTSVNKKRVPLWLAGSPYRAFLRRTKFTGFSEALLRNMTHLEFAVEAEESGPRKEHWTKLFVSREIWRAVVGYVCLALRGVEKLKKLKVVVETAFTGFDAEWLFECFKPVMGLGLERLVVVQNVMGNWSWRYEQCMSAVMERKKDRGWSVKPVSMDVAL